MHTTDPTVLVLHGIMYLYLSLKIIEKFDTKSAKILKLMKSDIPVLCV